MNGDAYELRRGTILLGWVIERPSYCNRGRYHAMANYGPLENPQDVWPRYYFIRENAQKELVLWLEANKISTEGAAGVHRSACPGTVDLAKLLEAAGKNPVKA